MNFGALGGRRSVSPPGSRTSSPVPRVARKTAEDALIKDDKNLRRYAALVDRALGTWETAPEEWADYIAFLSRLLKAIQGHGKNVSTLPQSSAVASKLAQCLNPALPSGVHQKALEVYSYIFSTFGRKFVAQHLHDFLPGLSGVLSFASLSIRPVLYELLQDYVVRLELDDVRPVLKALILSILPALEDEASEDFEEALSILTNLENAFVSSTDEDQSPETGGYFWQCLFLATITSPSRRQGALNYLSRRLPNFAGVKSMQAENGDREYILSSAAEAALTPESGLLLRSFACGLSDGQPLVQRGFLDLLVTHLPLRSPVLQERVSKPDFDRLTASAIGVLLRRDMSLNRRVWSWLLGPEPKESGNASPSVERGEHQNEDDSQQLQHFTKFGQASVERCLLGMLEQNALRPAEKARPFRICLSLMDRWEIGGVLVSRIFLPAMRGAYLYSGSATREESAEAIRSASLFFDGTESRLIWSELFKLVEDAAKAKSDSPDSLRFFRWILQHFNVREEEMITLHIPLIAGYLLDWINTVSSKHPASVLELADCAMILLEFVPARAFAPSSKKSKDSVETLKSSPNIRLAAEQYYGDRSAEVKVRLPSPSQLADVIVQRTFSVLSENLLDHPEVLAKGVQIATNLLFKIPENLELSVDGLVRGVTAKAQQNGGVVIQFSTISSVISLLGALSTHRSQQSHLRQTLKSLEFILLEQLWYYLSPTRAKHHVEAVRLIWQVDGLTRPKNGVKGGLNELMQKSSSGAALNGTQRIENVWRFTTLWTHTVPLQPVGSKQDGRGLIRRGSAMHNTDIDSWPRLQEMLSGPLLLSLDLLSDASVASQSAVSNLFASPGSIGLVFQIILAQMAALLDARSKPPPPHAHTADRDLKQQNRDVEYLLGHLQSILTLDGEEMWQGLAEMNLKTIQGVNDNDAVTWLATQCVQLLDAHDLASTSNARAISILRCLLSGPYPVKVRMKTLGLEDVLLGKIRGSLRLSEDASQASLLDLAVLSMGLRHLQSQSPDAHTSRRKFSLTSGRRSSVAPREEQASPLDSGSSRPPSQLLETLREGFVSTSSRVHMDAWLDFLAASLPFFGDMLLTNLIPLVDTFCDQLRQTFDDLHAVSKKGSNSEAFSPDSVILKQLEGLNMLLAEAHDRVLDEDIEPRRKASESSQSVLGSMASSAFKQQAPNPSKTAKANSRLTVILAFQDAIRVCVTIWMWSAGGPENEVSDRYNAATTSYYTHRMRNRTRAMLEQIFSVEPLESLEVIMTMWSNSASMSESGAVLSLLHVLAVSRPKSVVPAVLDALCSRTQANHMSPSHQSSLTSDLSAADVVAFFTAYLETVEDDATDEIWRDCTAFMRDVISNPLPFRQILPALLWVALILAEKLDNTNFGDQRKMRRELGDHFLRLLSATFAASPFSSYLDQNAQSASGSSETDLAAGRRNMDVVVILRHVVAKVESILDSVDRITNVVNTISTSLISPAFHAKAFPSIITPDLLSLLIRMTRKAPTAKSWRKEVSDAFNNPRFLDSSVDLTERYWFPVLQQWSQGDKERVNELLSRLAPPSSAGIMFGVGAAAARLKADSETQLVLRRLCLLLLASPIDSYAAQVQMFEEKLVELFVASASSSPSSTTKAELFMLCRALVLSTSQVNFAPLWPLINDQLQAALASLAPQDARHVNFTNLALLQSGKLLDLLVALAPDEFQLHEWLYITDTTDAVYHPPGWAPTALADQLAEHLNLEGGVDALPTAADPIQDASEGSSKALFGANLNYDQEDIKAMPLEDFARSIMRPFLSQLSINAYESTYGMASPDPGVYRRALLEDLLDSSTLVDHER